MPAIVTIANMVIKEIFRKKDFYVVFILIGVILFYAAGLQFYNVKNIARYLMEIGLMLIFLFSAILTVTLASRQVPAEMQNRTIHALLAKPITRAQFVLGKYLGCLFAGWSAYSIFYVLFIVVVWSKAGNLSLDVVFQTYFLYLLNILVLAAMTSALSYGITVSANVSISMILYILISTYGSGLNTAGANWNAVGRWICEIVYFLLPHYEFFDLRARLVHGWGPISLQLMALLSAYAVLYSAFFMLLAWAAFRKRPV